jgi:uncharacterized protein (DUF58 family)
MQLQELLAKIRLIELKSNKIVQEVFSGQYHSFFKGNGLEFQDIREYYAGDDVRDIDWNVTARQGKPYIKQFQEERELNVYILIDASQSTYFGQKRERITEIAATIALSAVKNSDKVGCLIFTDKVEKFIPSRKGKKHSLSILSSILGFAPQNHKTSLKKVIEEFTGFEKKRSIIFLISDFFDQFFEKQLAVLSKKHDLILIQITEKAEQELPKGAIFSFRDLETQEEMTIDNTLAQKKLNPLFVFKNIIPINTDDDFIKPLLLFFKRRK